MAIKQDIGAYSAYAIAVKYGYGGTEAQWVAAQEKARKDSEAAAEAAKSAQAEAEKARDQAQTAKANAETAQGAAANSTQTAQEAATTATQQAQAAQAAKIGAEAAETGAEAARTGAETAQAGAKAAQTAAETAAKEAQTARTGAEAAQKAAEAAQEKAEEAAQGVAEDRNKIEANATGLAETKEELAQTKTALETARKDLAKAQRAIKFQAELNQGQTWDFEADDAAAYQRTVPSGAHAGSVLEIGGMSQRDAENNVLIDAPVDEVRVANTAGESSGAYPIPQAIRDLCPDYGIGVSADCYNYIDFAAKQYHHVVGGYAFDGSENYLYFTQIATCSRVTVRIDIKRKPGIGKTLFSPYEFLYEFATDSKHYYVGKTDDSASGMAEMYVFDTFTTLDECRAALIGAKLYYELATPEVIDLSAVWPENFDLIFATEPGGSITMHYPKADEGYTLDVPAKIQYITKLSEVSADG